MSVEDRRDLVNLVLDIESAEDYLIDARRIWDAMAAHLNGRGLAEFGESESLTSAQYWSARTYLEGWLNCAGGEKVSRTVMQRQMLRMWEICPGLRPVTRDFCETRYGATHLSELTDTQLRAALFVTLADWRAALIAKDTVVRAAQPG
jgi:hypothetical protein